jgi:hypothetical protein
MKKWKLFAIVLVILSIWAGGLYAQTAGTSAATCTASDPGCAKTLYDNMIAAYRAYTSALSAGKEDPELLAAYKRALCNYCIVIGGKSQQGCPENCTSTAITVHPQPPSPGTTPTVATPSNEPVYHFSLTPAGASVVANGRDTVTLTYRIEDAIPRPTTSRSGIPVVILMQFNPREMESGGRIDSGQGPPTVSSAGLMDMTLSTVGITNDRGEVTIRYTAPSIKNLLFTSGLVSITVGHPQGNARAVITVKPFAGISGRVLNSVNIPMAGIPVEASSTQPTSGPAGRLKDPVYAMTDAKGEFKLYPERPGPYRVMIGRKWTKTSDPLFVRFRSVDRNTDLGDIIYATVEDHYLRNAMNLQKLYTWYETYIVKAGVRGLAHLSPELIYRLKLSFGSEMNRSRVVDVFNQNGYGKIGRCGDVSLYIIREFKAYFKNDPSMKELKLMEYTVVNYINPLSTHMAPIVIPSIIENTERLAFFDNGTLTQPVRTNTIILDAYAGNAGTAIKTYNQFSKQYMSKITSTEELGDPIDPP